MQYSLGNMLKGGGALNPDGLALDLAFALDKTLTARKGPTPAFTRSSTATFVGSNGLIQSAAINVPRFDYDPATGASKGLLIEESRTNLISQSASRTSVFATNGGTSSISTTTNPFGGLTTTNDNIFVESSLTEFHGGAISQTLTLSNATAYTFSTFVKPYGRQYVAIRLTTSFANTVCLFNLIGSGTASTITGTPLQVKIEPFINGWYRISVSATSTGTGSPYIGVYSSDALGGNTPAGLNDTAWALWGSQFEVGAFPLSYIPTTSGTAIRSADVCSITGTDFDRVYNQSELSIYSEVSFAPASAGFSVISFNNQTAAERVELAAFTGPTRLACFVVQNGTIQAAPNIAASANQFHKAALYAKVDSFQFALNGSLATKDTVGLMPTATRLNIGKQFNESYLNGHLKQVTIYRKALTDAKLQTLTAP